MKDSEDKKLKNAIMMKSKNPLKYDILFVDTVTNMSNSLFEKHGVNVKERGAFRRGKEPYRVMIVSFYKWDIFGVTDALEELEKKALVCGYSDYVFYCEKLYNDFSSGLTAEEYSLAKGIECHEMD